MKFVRHTCTKIYDIKSIKSIELGNSRRTSTIFALSSRSWAEYLAFMRDLKNLTQDFAVSSASNAKSRTWPREKMVTRQAERFPEAREIESSRATSRLYTQQILWDCTWSPPFYQMQREIKYSARKKQKVSPIAVFFEARGVKSTNCASQSGNPVLKVQN